MTDTVGFLKKRTARLEKGQQEVEELGNARRFMTSDRGRGLVCESCAGEVTELGFLSGDGDPPKTSPRYLGSDLETCWLVGGHLSS